MNTAYLFPGQASQKIGMGFDLFQKSKLGKKYQQYDKFKIIFIYDLALAAAHR